MRYGITLAALLLHACSHSPRLASCSGNPSLQVERSAELQKLLQEDQGERNKPIEQIDWPKASERDLTRRARVAQIFAEGCLAKAADYSAAALVFQHGDTADHAYQTFHWAQQAVKLGDEKQRWLTAAGLDRYLVRSGRKQLFGTQFFMEKNDPFCLEPVEKTFSDARRKEYLGTTLHGGIANFLKGIGSKQKESEVEECKHELRPSSEGTVPGFW